MTDAQIRRTIPFMFGAAFVLVLLGAITFVFSIAHLPVAGLINALLLLNAVFAVAGAGFGLAVGITGGFRRTGARF